VREWEKGTWRVGKRTRADGRVIHGAALSASRTAWASTAGARAVEDAEHGERERVPHCRRAPGLRKRGRNVFEYRQKVMAARTTQIQEREEGEPGPPDRRPRSSSFSSTCSRSAPSARSSRCLLSQSSQHPAVLALAFSTVSDSPGESLGSRDIHFPRPLLPAYASLNCLQRSALCVTS
jgi:hypothetical protein